MLIYLQCKNETHREELNKGSTEGLDLHGVGHTVLPKELVTEAIILSDMYDLNEYMALDLLGTGMTFSPLVYFLSILLKKNIFSNCRLISIKLTFKMCFLFRASFKVLTFVIFIWLWFFLYLIK